MSISNAATTLESPSDSTISRATPKSNLNKRLIPVTQWNEHHLWPPVGGLRYLIFNADKNGFDSVIVRVNKRVLIDEKAFFDWVETQKENS